jgi:hypothetical protein
MKIHIHEHVRLICRHLKVTSPAGNDGDSSHQKYKDHTKVWPFYSGYHVDTRLRISNKETQKEKFIILTLLGLIDFLESRSTQQV